jgi:hypothetical protein
VLPASGPDLVDAMIKVPANFTEAAVVVRMTRF